MLGRFLSADTIVPDGTNPQAFNRYAYTYNNPVRYIDPSGHFTIGQIKDWSNYRTDEDIRKLHDENPDIYFMLLQMHFGDNVYTKDGWFGKVGLMDGTLVFGNLSVLGLIDLRNSSANPGFEVRRLMVGHKTGWNIPVVYRSGAYCDGCTGEIRELGTPGYEAESAEWIPTISSESDQTTHYSTIGDILVDAGVGLAASAGTGAACAAASGGTCAVPGLVIGGVSAALTVGFEIGKQVVRRSVDGLQENDRVFSYSYSGGWHERAVIRDGQLLRYEMNR